MTTTTMEFNSVTFTNFPAFLENGEITGYPLMSAVVADRYAERFSVEDRKALTVDYSQLDIEALMLEAKNDMGLDSPFKSETEAENAEQALIRFIFGSEE